MAISAACETLELVKIYLEIANYIFIIFGVLFAVVFYPKSQFEKSYGQLNDHFLRFLELQLEWPGLGTNTFDREIVVFRDLHDDPARQELIFDYLLSLLERAFYYLHTGLDQYLPWKWWEWKSWHKWLRVYKGNQNFVKFWKKVRKESCYGAKFVDFMDNELLP